MICVQLTPQQPNKQHQGAAGEKKNQDIHGLIIPACHKPLAVPELFKMRRLYAKLAAFDYQGNAHDSIQAAHRPMAGQPDPAQKKIDGLTTNMVSLQELLGDKRSRGAFGEVQLEGLVRNLLPEAAFEFQYTFPNGTRVDCVLKLPEPTGLVAVDSKFPLESYEAMFGEGLERTTPTAFKTAVKRHIEDIAGKYIIGNTTSDGAVMFIPAESVFAEIHAHHRDLVEYAQTRRVWIVSPTTLMAVLNTARAVLKDTETRKQVHIIQDELGKLGKDFARFDERMKKLATHIQQASKDVEEVHISSRKITDRFARIERVELEDGSVAPLELPLEGGNDD